MEKASNNNVTINQNSTIRTGNLSTPIPLEGYPLLQHMEDLQEQYHFIKQKLYEQNKITSGHRAATPATSRKKENLKKLKEKLEQIQKEFDFYVYSVQEYAKAFDDIDYKIIISHYCNINKVRGDLQKDINPYLVCTANNFRVKLKNCWLKNLVK